MNLADLDIACVGKAVAIYLDLGYGGGGPRRMPDLSLPPDARGEAVLQIFTRECVEAAPGQQRVRYALRLGNRNYPFMKLVLQEHLVADHFYFAVDTHDDMDIKPDYPDYEAWMAVRRFNRSLKQQIESQFASEGLDTAATLREIVTRRPAAEAVPGCRGHVLVVDDEEDLAETVRCLLEARGYRVTEAHDGVGGLEKARDLLPDLVFLDYELPEMDGLQVLEALRRDERTRAIPVLLATASRIALRDIEKADGFLAKPFQEGLLYEMVQRLLKLSENSVG